MPYVDLLKDLTSWTGNDAAFGELINENTQGNPLFIVETISNLVAEGHLPSTDEEWEDAFRKQMDVIPSQIQTIINSRLNKLDKPSRELLTAAAVTRGEFGKDLLIELSDLSEKETWACLENLLACGLLIDTRHGLFTFSHDKIREVTYKGLSQPRRTSLHRCVAEAIKKHYPNEMPTMAAHLAYHYEQAGDEVEALHYYLQSARLSEEKFAAETAIGYYQRALSQLVLMPSSRERDRQELTLQITLGKVLMTVHGYGAAAVEDAYVRAQTLCDKLGVISELSQVLAGLRTCYMMRGNLEAARNLGEQCLEIAQRVHDLPLLLAAHEGLGVTFTHQGEFLSSMVHLEQGLALYNPEKRHIYHALPDPGVDCLSYAALIFWILGYPDKALRRSQRAVALAYKLAHPHSIAVAHFFAAVFHHFRRKVADVQEHAELAIKVSIEHEFKQWIEHANVMRGWALTQLDQCEEAVDSIQQALKALTTVWGNLARPHYLCLLARAYEKIGRLEDALCVVNAAEQSAQESSEFWSQSEMFRLKAELLHKNGAAEIEIEGCLLHAIEIARRQQARSFELRAIMDLSKLSDTQVKREIARAELNDIYSWFTEGIDTPDLLEAKALLDQLPSE
ncbi:tetratricopeptide repeat protein [Chloroflexi bacterium TSY]|nr:tetratricopeptide repeat protein [Chloroflexi bacterium TSY]